MMSKNMKPSLPLLPLPLDLETKAVLKKTVSARSALSELKGSLNSIPEQDVLLNLFSLLEAKENAVLEDVEVAPDELYAVNADHSSRSEAMREIKAYKNALHFGYKDIKVTNLLSKSTILLIQSLLTGNQAGFRQHASPPPLSDYFYEPPQKFLDLMKYILNLEQFINDSALSDLDPTVKMALISYQFVCIAPFEIDTEPIGRVINTLYLVKEGLLTTPILHFNHYLVQNKDAYLDFLQRKYTENLLEDWILFFLEGIAQSAEHTLALIYGIRDLMLSHKDRIKSELPKIYSGDLLNNIFYYPYTTIELMIDSLDVSRNTAIKYLEELVEINILVKSKLGKENCFINRELVELLS
jgi:Fic family protein